MSGRTRPVLGSFNLKATRAHRLLGNSVRTLKDETSRQPNARPGFSLLIGPVALHFQRRYFQMNLSQTLAAISKLRRSAAEIERDLHRHAAAAVSDPVMHGKLFRLHGVI